MIKTEQPLLLALAVVLILGAIVFLQAGKATPTPSSLPSDSVLAGASPSSKADFVAAPELQGIAGYLNAPEGFRLSDVKGKVILVDFWTYSCINCIRTLPYLVDWHAKYADQGLVIVGVHTPEFDFEKKLDNVQAAVAEHDIQYSVVLDNDYATWRAYRNQYWPHKYLVDADGYIRYDHIGEGGYEETEAQIVKLLQERNASIAMNRSTRTVAAEAPGDVRTPEIYFGYQFIRQPLGNDQELSAETPINFSFPASDAFEPNLAYLDGTWILKRDYAELVSDRGQVALTFFAGKANIVAGAPTAQMVSVQLDGRLHQHVAVQAHDLYPIASASKASEHTMVFNVSKGFQLYTFTFG